MASFLLLEKMQIIIMNCNTFHEWNVSIINCKSLKFRKLNWLCRTDMPKEEGNLAGKVVCFSSLRQN